MLKSKEMKLIPFTVQELVKESSVVPDGVQMMGVPFMWEQGYQGHDVVVAILDTGCEKEHPDLKERIIDGRNFTTEFRDIFNYADTNGHGTHVAGTIAADGNSGLFGVAPMAKLLICKVLDGDGSGSYEGIINGINYAVNWRGPNGERVRIINMSLGGAEDVPELHEAVKDAVDAGILVVCAAGNEGDANEDTSEYAYPGAYNEVIEIGAVDSRKVLAPFSNNNAELDAVAPGVDILSAFPGSQYARMSGTSMASPHAAGALALLTVKAEKEFGRGLSEAELYAQLIKNTEDIGYRKSSVGNGFIRLDIQENLKELRSCLQKFL